MDALWNDEATEDEVLDAFDEATEDEVLDAFDEATEDEVLDAFQALVNSGEAWRLEGHVGRTAMGLLEERLIGLGEIGHHDYFGSYVPSRHEVLAGSKGASEYARF